MGISLFAIGVGLQAYSILKILFRKIDKLTIRSERTGEIAEFHFEKKNDVDEVIRFLDILLDHR
jgi:hypothetical protein